MTSKNIFAAALFSLALPVLAQNSSASPPLEPMPSVDLQRYQGIWHQLAHYPNRFQKDCASNTQAQYSAQADGTLEVINRCRTADGKETQAIGQARAAPDALRTGDLLAPPTLQVRFAPSWLSWLPKVWGNYWIIQLAPDYRYAVIGEPGREFLWVLARNTSLAQAEWSLIKARLLEQGYDPSRLQVETHLPPQKSGP